MNAVLFDTLRLSRTLREKGHFTPEQAEDLAEALGGATHEDLATKSDVAALKSDMAELKSELKAEIAELKTEIVAVRAELKTEIAEVRAEITVIKGAIGNLVTKAELAEVRAEIAGIKSEIATVKADLLKWVVGAVGFQTVATLGTVIALVRIFAK